jgi:hypothetical protein
LLRGFHWLGDDLPANALSSTLLALLWKSNGKSAMPLSWKRAFRSTMTTTPFFKIDQ